MSHADLPAQQQVHIEALQECDQTRDYKAPHANRGTPPRPHFSRYTRIKRAFKCQ